MAPVAPRITFVFRPGETSPDENVFADFADLVAAMDGVPGLKLIEFDDSLLGTITPIPPSHITLPAGNFPMHLVSWTASAPRIDSDGARTHVKVEVPEGCRLPGLRMISGQIEIECSADTPPVADFSASGRHHLIQFGSRLDNGIPFLYCTGNGPFFDLRDLGSPAGKGQCVIVVSPGHWAEAVNPATVITHPPASVRAGTVIFRLLPFGVAGRNMIRAEANAGVILDWHGGIEAEEHSSIAGRFEIRNVNRSRSRLMPQSLKAGVATKPSTQPVSQIQTGDLILIKPEGNPPLAKIEQELPRIQGSFQGRPKSTLGHRLTVKNAAEATTSAPFRLVVIEPAADDFIDGTKDPVVLRGGESCTFASDGFNTWYVVGFSERPRRSPT